MKPHYGKWDQIETTNNISLVSHIVAMIDSETYEPFTLVQGNCPQHCQHLEKMQGHDLE